MEMLNELNKANFSLKLIPFVSPVAEKSEEVISETECDFSTNLNGEEVSKFYKEIITSPSEPKPPVALQSNKKELSKEINSKIKKRSIFPSTLSNDNVSPDSIFLHAQEGNLKRLKDCIDNGNSFDCQDAYGWTPLMCSTCEGHYHCVKYLLECGANIHIKCKNGTTALDIAKKKNNIPIIQLLQNGVPLIQHSDSVSCTRKVDEAEKYCDVCKLFYKTSTVIHERSIAHLVSDKKPNLSTIYHIPENNKGFQIMLKSGWDKNKGLGPKAEGRKFPIKTVLKKDRSCIGKTKEISKVTHFSANDDSSIKGNKNVPIKTVREKTLKKWEREKIERINRQKEIKFRRQFLCDF